MEARYTASYALLGLNKFADGSTAPRLFFQSTTPQATFTLTIDPSPLLQHVDTHAALGQMLLSRFTGQPSSGTPEEQLQRRIGQMRASRLQAIGGHVCLVVEGNTDVSPPDLNGRGNIADASFALNVFDNAPVQERFEPIIQSALTALSLFSPVKADLAVRPLGAATYLIDPQTGSPIHCLRLVASGSMRIATPLTDDAIVQASKCVAGIHDDSSLKKVADLLSESQEDSLHELRAFVASWSALEIFTNTTFKSTYEKMWFEAMAASAPTSASKYFSHLEGVMKDKHRLNDKFLILASILDENGALEDAEKFAALKAARDALFHTPSKGTKDYPTAVAQNLLRKYFVAHLRKTGCA